MPRHLRRWALNGAAGLGLGFILLPLLLVMWLAFFRQEIPSFPPEGYSLKWFAEIPGNRAFTSGFLLSLQVSIAATAIGLLLAVPASMALVRSRLPLRGVLNTLLLLPLVVPGVVLGAAFYVGELELEMATEWPLLGSTIGLVIAHTLVVIPWAVRLITASLGTLNPTIEEAARNLGATPLTTFRRITLPAIRPGLVAGALFGFVTSFGNLEASLFLVGPGQTTLPIAILQYLAWKIDPTVAAVSLLQILVIGIAMLVTDRFVKLSQVV
ncbi:ABC transporter permease [Teichococcus aerophilus]|uniref:ABC transporter permease n=1 Tax=Teichococcus aerophilus TaxID=1224513 RepID=UPI0019D619B0|nr:ABC transporter permease subunit [Pseudoroseomonas aerophila]